MIYFIHGDNNVSSRNKLNELTTKAKVKKQEIIKLDGLKIDANTLIQALESSSLFGQEKLIIIENLFSRSASKEKELMIKNLKKNEIIPDLICWEKKEIPGTTTRWLPKNWQFILFKTPAIIFKFLDSLHPKNQNQMLLLMRQIIKSESAEMVFYMLARRIRELIIASDLGASELRGAPWQISRLIAQAKNFNLKQLIINYQQLLSIDTDIKTGASFMPLDWHLEIFAANM